MHMFMFLTWIFQELQQMEQQQELIQQLEEQQHKTEQMLDSCSKDDEEELLEQHQQQTDGIEHQQKIFDDLEFKQLEVLLTTVYSV